MIDPLPGGMDDTGPTKPEEPNPLAELFDLVGTLIDLYESKPSVTVAKKIPPEIEALKKLARSRGLGSNPATMDAMVALDMRFVAAKRQANKKNYPIKDKFYCYSGKENGMEDAERLGFERGTDAYENYCGTGHEVGFEVLVYEDGTVKATHVNGVELVGPVVL